MEIRDLQLQETEFLGQLMVKVYSGLTGFPSQQEQTAYHEILVNIGRYAEYNDTHVCVVVPPDGALAGGIVYFGDKSKYGSGGIAIQETNTSGIRLFAVDPHQQGKGFSKALIHACIEWAKKPGHAQAVLHTTLVMKAARGLYQKLGFIHSPDLDFFQQGLPVSGFRLKL